MSERADDVRVPVNDASTLEARAPGLARAHQPLNRARARGADLVDLRALSRSIERATREFRNPKPDDPVYQKAAEWLLDNQFLVARTIRQVGSELPKGFRERLPHVGADELPRVLRISHALVEATSLDFDEAALLGFVAAYQRQAPLGIAELWALPTMLRISILEALVQMLDVFFPPAQARPRWWDLLIDPAVGIARAIRALRLLAELDWKAFFQTTSAVDAALRADPAGIYALMDFETRDAYRKVVEELAWVAERPEPDVAALAISLASEHAGDPRESHVGYYLVGPGRTTLEQRIGYRRKGIEWLRRCVQNHPTRAYLGLISGATLLMVAGVAAFGARALGTGATVILCALAIVPLSSIAVAFTNWCVTAFLSPRTLPKLDFAEKIPDECKTAVVIPVLVASPRDIDELFAQLERHYLANPDPALAFVLLTDHVDSDEMPDDEQLLAHAQEVLDALNRKHGAGERAPFHLLYRESSFNPAEGRFMGWERKRGKLEEFNRLLAGSTTTSFKRHLGDPGGLLGVRFVITLDADTHLPLGAAQRLIGLLAHPLNRAVFQARTGRVISGYTVVQPRIEASPVARAESWFSRTFAGDTALDIYTRAVSDVYQDLFGSGIYVGKGIYDVAAFTRSLEGRVPDNTLASHDLFEGIHGRVGLATDVVLFEEYPHNYLVFARRMHRWIRGDWQLLPWLLPRLRSAGPSGSAFRLSVIDRWKIADNLRRSLLAPSLLALVVFGWFAFPEQALFWAAAPLLVPLAVLAPSLLGDQRKESIARWAFGVALLAYEAWLAADAIVRVFVRLTVTRKHLLQWVTAAHAERALTERSSRGFFFREMRAALLFTLLLVAALSLLRPSALLFAAPLCVLFLLSPEIARRSSAPPVVRKDLDADDRRVLRRLARRTWLFFETFVGPVDQWLPPDNFQQEPAGRIAHRTSPTNIGLMLVAELSAWDLGYVGPSELSALLQQSFDSLGRLERYKGHFLNWYDTKTREALLPRYVSTVDSGNLAAALITLAKGCRDAADAPLLGPSRLEGLVDALDLLEEALHELPREQVPLGALSRIRSMLEEAHHDASDCRVCVVALSESELPLLERALLDILEKTTDHHDISTLREARTWLERLNHQLRGVRGDIETFLPWLELAEDARRLGFELTFDLTPPAQVGLSGVGDVVEKARIALRELSTELASPDRVAWLEQAEARLKTAQTRAGALREELFLLAARADVAWAAMDFAFLYDGKRKLFHIGYNATSDRLDPHYYDLLASEARLASFIAVIQKHAPPTHWHVLGRPVTKIHGSVALLSWGGTMFEYLLPPIFMHSPDRTLLAQSEELAVLAQIDYGKRTGTPWGISESGFAELDAQHDYQYRSFGVPGLGVKRGLEEDLVIAPYACVLALAIRPRETLQNLAELQAIGALGTYGLFEAVDFHPSRADEATRETARAYPPFAVVRSHMAHHQGMILATLDNALNDNVHVERFHADPLVQTGELLLSERLPSARVAETLDRPKKEPIEAPVTAVPTFPSWSPEGSTAEPEVALLTNGRLTTLVTDTGAGFTRFKRVAVTRGGSDPTCDLDGVFLYVRDEGSGKSWSATPAPTRARMATDHVVFHAHKVEFHHREQGISIRTEIGIGPLDDIEIRYVTLHNETDEARTLTLASCLEPVLESAASAARHPAFSRLFLECQALPEQHAILASRRKRSPDELDAVAVHAAVWDSPAVSWVGFQTDRAAFIGRRRDARAPRMTLDTSASIARSKAALDPVMALAVEVTLEPSATAKVAFVTAVGKTREAALDLTRRYASLHAVRWAVHDAERESARRLEAAGIAPALLPDVMHLVSRLLFPGPQYRAPRAAQLVAGPSKPQLWRHGISGDDPLFVVRVRDPDANPLAAEVLATYRYLRTCKVPIELVFLDESASGYQAEATGSVRRFLMRKGASSWLHQRGGIFALATDQLSPEDRLVIEAAARVFIDAERGSLREQRLSLPATPPPLPHFSATLSPDATSPRALSLPKLAFTNGYGGFTPDGREYAIVLKDGRTTPAPWCNVLANAEFGCLTSESSLGASWSLNSGENRLTPWRNDAVSDTPSEALYLRDEETAEVWSPTPLPAGLGADALVRHGAGYTVYQRESHGLGQELTVFVPPDAPVKILRLRLENRLARPRRLTATYYAEWVLGALRDEQQAHVVCEFDAAAQCAFARSAWSGDFAERVAFVAADRTPHGFTCDRSEFIGRSGSLAEPEALERWGLAGSTRPGVDPCAALQTHLELGPGQSLELHFVLGQGRDREHALELVERFRQPAEVEAAWRRLGSHWDALLGAVQVKTPEPALDLMLNRWLLYQSLSSRLFARSAFYQSGGAFGFRDQLQDAMAFVHVVPDVVRAHILEAASRQFEEGDVMHWWHPPAGRGVRTRCSDDLLWLPFVAAHYVATTGDTSILSEQVSFLSATPLEPGEHDRYAEFAVAPERASLLEHCRRALTRGFSEGPQGLPLIAGGDWNDGMNRVGLQGRGESVWLAWFVHATAIAFSELLERQGERLEAESWRERARELAARVEQVAWDGAWYVRAFYDDGTPLGSARSRSCRIDSIAQSWAALSGAGDKQRVEQALRSADELLVREHERLVLLLDPPFEGARHDPGYIKSYPPGVRENGGQYTHAAAWLGFAHARVGDGAGAERIFRLLNPILRTETAMDVERYRVEPYVLAADIYSAPGLAGRGGWTWYTGAAAWLWRLGAEAILGLYRENGALRFNPCIPPEWPGFEATLRIGEHELQVVVDNPHRTGRGVRELTLDGVVLESPLVRLDSVKKTRHEVHIVLGEPIAVPMRPAAERPVKIASTRR